MTCELAHDAGAYVLGALSPDERLVFERHLAGCADCTRSVGEMAGLPGLLSRIDVGVLERPAVDEPVPATLLPSLAREVRRLHRRRLMVTVAAAAAVLVVATLGVVALRGRADAPGATRTGQIAGPAASRVMHPVGDAPVRARLGLESVAWGTRLDLVCRYAPGPEQYELPSAVTYALVVHTRDGRTEQVGTWRSVEGRTMHLVAGTAATRKDITSVEVEMLDQRPVLTLPG